MDISLRYGRIIQVLHYALIPIFLEFRSSDLYYISKCRNDGPINESSLKNGPTIAIVRGLANIWFFNVLLLNRAIFGMFEGVQEGIRTQFFCGEVKFNIIATSRNVLRLWKHFWRPLEAAWGHNGHRMQKWYNFHPKDTYYSWALPSNIILRLILRLIEVIWGCLRSFEVILLCKSLVEGISDIKCSLCIR